MAKQNRSKTAEKQRKNTKKAMPKGVPFKANDPTTGERDERINRGGRPTLEAGFDSLRKMALSIAQEKAQDRYGKPMLAPDKAEMTIAETILRMMAQDPKRQQAFLEISSGKPADIFMHLMQNVDLTLLSEEQLRRLANGEDLVTILLTTQGQGPNGTPPATPGGYDPDGPGAVE